MVINIVTVNRNFDVYKDGNRHSSVYYVLHTRNHMHVEDINEDRIISHLQDLTKAPTKDHSQLSHDVYTHVYSISRPFVSSNPKRLFHFTSKEGAVQIGQPLIEEDNDKDNEEGLSKGEDEEDYDDEARNTQRYMFNFAFEYEYDIENRQGPSVRAALEESLKSEADRYFSLFLPQLSRDMYLSRAKLSSDELLEKTKKYIETASGELGDKCRKYFESTPIVSVCCTLEIKGNKVRDVTHLEENNIYEKNKPMNFLYGEVFQ